MLLVLPVTFHTPLPSTDAQKAPREALVCGSQDRRRQQQQQQVNLMEVQAPLFEYSFTAWPVYKNKP